MGNQLTKKEREDLLRFQIMRSLYKKPSRKENDEHEEDTPFSFRCLELEDERE